MMLTEYDLEKQKLYYVEEKEVTSAPLDTAAAITPRSTRNEYLCYSSAPAIWSDPF